MGNLFMDDKTFVNTAVLFLRHGTDITKGSGNVKIEIHGITFSCGPSYEFFIGENWTVRRTYENGSGCLYLIGDEEVIQRDMDRVLVLGVLDGTFPQDIKIGLL